MFYMTRLVILSYWIKKRINPALIAQYIIHKTDVTLEPRSLSQSTNTFNNRSNDGCTESQ